MINESLKALRKSAEATNQRGKSDDKLKVNSENLNFNSSSIFSGVSEDDLKVLNTARDPITKISEECNIIESTSGILSRSSLRNRQRGMKRDGYASGSTSIPQTLATSNLFSKSNFTENTRGYYTF